MSKTIITFPADSGYAEKMEAITAHTVGGRTLEDHPTVTGSHVTLLTRDGLYLIYVHGYGYHRLTVMDDERDARRLLQLLIEVHGVCPGIG